MFHVGDTVVCGSNGVCTIETIGPLSIMRKTESHRDYYTLQPYFDNNGKVYLPVDNDKVVMRYILSPEEVNSLLHEIDTIGQLSISDEKQRETEYKNAVNSLDPRILIKAIKTMYYRRKSRIESGKKSTSIDDKYYRIAEKRLYDEIALALDIKRDDIRDLILNSIEG